MTKPLPRRAAGAQISLDWLPVASDSRREAFSLLQRLSGHEAALPADTPRLGEPNIALNLPNWLRDRYRTAGRDKTLLSGVLAENLLLAGQLLVDKDEAMQRLGLQTAHEAALKSAMRLNEKVLCARIFEGFILPFVNDAPDKATVEAPLNKQQLIQDACSAYRQAGDNEKLFQGVVVLVTIAEKAGDKEGADWARIKLAEGLTERGRYGDAINALRAVSSPNLAGAKKWIPDLEKRLQGASTPVTTPVTNPTP